MGMHVDAGDEQRIKDKARRFFEGFADDLKLAGEVARDEIVRTTLAGIGAGDASFRPYSASYQARLDAVGGKAQQTVNLRGVFYPPGTGPKPTKRDKASPAAMAAFERRLLAKGALRRAYVTVQAGGRTFQAQTGTTRPAVGLTDKLSEMSADLITVQTTDESLTLIYTPRARDYMVQHQDTRPWFSANKRAVAAAMVQVVRTALEARAQWFNRGG